MTEVPDGAGTLLQAVAHLWPNGKVVGTEPAGAVDEITHWYAFVPSAAQARFLLPLSNRNSAGEALRKYSSSLTVREIAQRSLMSFAFRWGGTALLRDRVGVSGERESLRSHLSDLLGEPVTFSISVGTARVNRKPILQIFSARGRTLAFAKVGDGESARLVRNEAAALRQLEGRVAPHLEVPRVLHAGAWRDSSILLITPLKISMWQRPGGQTVVPTGAMLHLSRAFQGEDQRLEDTPLWAVLQRSLPALTMGPLQEQLSRLLPELASVAGDRPLRTGAWHGDWTSWNMARARDRVLLWDWERFETGVLQGQDHCHFVVNASTRAKGFDSAIILRALRDVNPVGQDDAARIATIGAYLASLAMRYALSAQGPSGSLIAARAGSVVDALRLWLSQPIR